MKMCNYVTILISIIAFLPLTGTSQSGITRELAFQISFDHVTVVVHSQEDAQRDFNHLGFNLKPGRLHANGLMNSFTKFANGTYLELITPQEGVKDELSGKYVEQLSKSEGGMFLAFKTDSLEIIARQFDSMCHETRLEVYRGAFKTLAFEESNLSKVFLIEYLSQVVDSPEVFDHPNTAIGIETVWLDQTTHHSLRSISSFKQIRGIAADKEFSESTPIVGVTIRVRSIEAARRVIQERTGIEFTIQSSSHGTYIRVPASHARGIWIEFKELIESK